MSFEQVVEFAARQHIAYLELTSGHLNPSASREDILRKKELLDVKGINAYALGVCATSTDKERNRRLFECAKLMGAKLLVVEPKDPAEWDSLEELVKEYDIKLAIHNHGKGTVYCDPASVKAVLAKRDKRIGVCLDIGWITAAGYDAAKVFREYGDRVYDIHFKDKRTAAGPDGKETILDLVPGTGSVNFAGLFAEIKRSGWSGVMSIETDNKSFQLNPMELVPAAQVFFAKNVEQPAP